MDEFNALTEISPTVIPECQPVEPLLIQLAEMLALGKSTAYISEELSRSTAWVRMHKNDPEVLSLKAQLQREALESAKSTIVTGTATAAETMLQLAESGPPMVRLAAAKDLLDRVGLKAPEKTQTDINVNVNHYTREERIRSIRDRASRLGLVVTNVSVE